MKEIRIKRYIRILFGITILVFLINKFYVRPWVLENELPGAFQIVVLSIPNFIEAIVGSLLLAGVLLQLRHYFDNRTGAVKDASIYILAVAIAAIYVISQELKYHNFGGNNVFDPNDLVASIVGILGTLFILLACGFVDKPKHG